MSPLAHLLLAAAALHAACAASLPEPGSKLIVDLKPELEGPLDKDAAPEAVAIEQTSVVEDSNNELRARPEDIPVNIVIEDSQPAIKTNEVADDDEEIKRPSIDLKNPGPPQRQEHETQNADHFPDTQEKLLTVQETIRQTQDVLQQGIQGIGDDISHWLSTNEQMNTIQQNIQSLRDTFTVQIQKINEVTKGLATTHALKTEEIPGQAQAQVQPDLKDVETRIQNFENNFNNGVRALSEGVNIVAILRAEDGNADVAEPAPAPAPAQPPPAATTNPGQNIVLQFMSNLNNMVTNSLNDISGAFANSTYLSNFFNPTSTLAPGIQADTPEGTTQRPSNNPWNLQLPSFPNFLNNFRPQGQGDLSQNLTAASRPIVSWFGSLQNATQNLFQNGLGRPGASQATTSGAAVNNAAPQNPVAEKHPEPPAIPASVAAAPPATAAPTGPIREMLSNSPVVQSIAGTVQRIQSSITNPERPRDTEKSDDLQTKGGFHSGYKPGASGDSDNSRSGLKPQSTDAIKEDIILDETKKQDDDKKTPTVVLEKTE